MTEYRNILVLTGAGVSAESGISTFRDSDGLWQHYRIEDVASPEGFARDPATVHQFYNDRRRHLPEVQPNAAHRALARLEREAPGDVLIVTQNIDDLHERAGSENVLHMHGELLKAWCSACGGITPWSGDLSTVTSCPACGRAGGMRPNVVWFGEMPLGLERIYEALDRCDLFLSIGTSGSVYPAAGFVAEVRAGGRAETVELNLEPSDGSHLFDDAIHGPAGEIVPDFVDRLLND